jgi:hypothetical protein
MVLGAYRKDDFADPDNFLLQLCIILEKYADSTIEHVTDPTTGIQRECKFPPTIAEFVAFCDEVKRRATFVSQYDERSKRQLEERERFERQAREGKEADPQYRKQVVERIKNEMRAHGFKFAEDKTPHKETAATVMAKYNLTQEQWDSLPNAPTKSDYWQGVRWPND